MSESLRQERFELGQNLVADESVEVVRELVKVPGRLVPADSYNSGTFDLHLHFRWAAEEYCAVIEYADDILGDAVVAHLGLGQARNDGDELPVLVGVWKALSIERG